jgi:hypothetical protein
MKRERQKIGVFFFFHLCAAGEKRYATKRFFSFFPAEEQKNQHKNQKYYAVFMIYTSL